MPIRPLFARLLLPLALLACAVAPAIAESDAIISYERQANNTLLKRLILAETDYEDAQSDFERVNILRTWVWENTNFAWEDYQSFNVEPDWYDLVSPDGAATAGAHIAAHMRHEMGDMCGHLSWLLIKIYDLFGYDVGPAVWNAPNVYGHTYVAVKIEHEGEPIWTIQDPTYDHTVTVNGEPADIRAVMKALAAGGEGVAVVPGAGVQRTFLATEAEAKAMLNPMFLSPTPDSIEGDQYVFSTAHKWDQFIEPGFTGPLIADALGEMGAPADPRFAMLYLVTNGPTMAIWADMQAIRDEALAALD